MSGMLNRMVEAMHTAVAADSGTMEDVARAALLAIREPDEAMLKAGRDAAQSANAHSVGWADEAQSVCRSMIDAILAEGASE